MLPKRYFFELLDQEWLEYLVISKNIELEAVGAAQSIREMDVVAQ